MITKLLLTTASFVPLKRTFLVTVAVAAVATTFLPSEAKAFCIGWAGLGIGDCGPVAPPPPRAILTTTPVAPAEPVAAAPAAPSQDALKSATAELNAAKVISDAKGDFVTSNLLQKSIQLITNDGGTLVSNASGTGVLNDGNSIASNALKLAGASAVQQTDFAKLITNDGGTLIARATMVQQAFIAGAFKNDGLTDLQAIALSAFVKNGGNVISNDGNSLTLSAGAKAALISQDGGTLASRGASLISQDGGTLVSTAGGTALAPGSSLINTYGSKLLTDNGSGIISEHGAGLISNASSGVLAAGLGAAAGAVLNRNLMGAVDANDRATKVDAAMRAAEGANRPSVAVPQEVSSANDAVKKASAQLKADAELLRNAASAKDASQVANLQTLQAKVATDTKALDAAGAILALQAASVKDTDKGSAAATDLLVQTQKDLRPVRELADAAQAAAAVAGTRIALIPAQDASKAVLNASDLTKKDALALQDAKNGNDQNLVLQLQTKLDNDNKALRDASLVLAGKVTLVQPSDVDAVQKLIATTMQAVQKDSENAKTGISRLVLAPIQSAAQAVNSASDLVTRDRAALDTAIANKDHSLVGQLLTKLNIDTAAVNKAVVDLGNKVADVNSSDKAAALSIFNQNKDVAANRVAASTVDLSAKVMTVNTVAEYVPTAAERRAVIDANAWALAAKDRSDAAFKGLSFDRPSDPDKLKEVNRALAVAAKTDREATVFKQKAELAAMKERGASSYEIQNFQRDVLDKAIRDWTVVTNMADPKIDYAGKRVDADVASADLTNANAALAAFKQANGGQAPADPKQLAIFNSMNDLQRVAQDRADKTNADVTAARLQANGANPADIKVQTDISAAKQNDINAIVSKNGVPLTNVTALVQDAVSTLKNTPAAVQAIAAILPSATTNGSDPAIAQALAALAATQKDGATATAAVAQQLARTAPQLPSGAPGSSSASSKPLTTLTLQSPTGGGAPLNAVTAPAGIATPVVVATDPAVDKSSLTPAVVQQLLQAGPMVVQGLQDQQTAAVARGDKVTAEGLGRSIASLQAQIAVAKTMPVPDPASPAAASSAASPAAKSPAVAATTPAATNPSGNVATATPALTPAVPSGSKPATAETKTVPDANAAVVAVKSASDNAFAGLSFERGQDSAKQKEINQKLAVAAISDRKGTVEKQEAALADMKAKGASKYETDNFQRDVLGKAKSDLAFVTKMADPNINYVGKRIDADTAATDLTNAKAVVDGLTKAYGSNRPTDPQQFTNITTAMVVQKLAQDKADQTAADVSAARLTAQGANNLEIQAQKDLSAAKKKNYDSILKSNLAIATAVGLVPAAGAAALISRDSPPTIAGAIQSLILTASTQSNAAAKAALAGVSQQANDAVKAALPGQSSAVLLPLAASGLVATANSAASPSAVSAPVGVGPASASPAGASTAASGAVGALAAAPAGSASATSGLTPDQAKQMLQAGPAVVKLLTDQANAQTDPAKAAAFRKDAANVQQQIDAAGKMPAAVPVVVATAPGKPVASAVTPADPTGSGGAIVPPVRAPAGEPQALLKLSAEQSKNIKLALTKVPGTQSKDDATLFGNLAKLADRAATQGLTREDVTTLTAGLDKVAKLSPKADQQHGLTSIAVALATSKPATAVTTPAAPATSTALKPTVTPAAPAAAPSPSPKATVATTTPPAVQPSAAKPDQGHTQEGKPQPLVAPTAASATTTPIPSVQPTQPHTQEVKPAVVATPPVSTAMKPPPVAAVRINPVAPPVNSAPKPPPVAAVQIPPVTPPVNMAPKPPPVAAVRINPVAPPVNTAPKPPPVAAVQIKPVVPAAPAPKAPTCTMQNQGGKMVSVCQ